MRTRISQESICPSIRSFFLIFFFFSVCIFAEYNDWIENQDSFSKSQLKLNLDRMQIRLYYIRIKYNAEIIVIAKKITTEIS